MAKDPSKTEKATPKRRKKARGEGNVPKSQELTKTATVMAGMLGLYVYFSIIAEHARELFQFFFANAATTPVTAENAYALFLLAARELAVMILPVILFIGLTAYVTLRLQVGKLWTTKVFKFKWQNFNIINGLKRMLFSPQTFVRLGKSAALALIIGTVPFLFIREEFRNFLPHYYSDAAGLGAFWLYARKARGVALDRDARAAGGCLHPAAFAAAGGYRLRTAVEVPLRHRWLLLPK